MRVIEKRIKALEDRRPLKNNDDVWNLDVFSVSELRELRRLLEKAGGEEGLIDTSRLAVREREVLGKLVSKAQIW